MIPTMSLMNLVKIAIHYSRGKHSLSILHKAALRHQNQATNLLFVNEVKQSRSNLEQSQELDCFADARKDIFLAPTIIHAITLHKVRNGVAYTNSACYSLHSTLFFLFNRPHFHNEFVHGTWQ